MCGHLEILSVRSANLPAGEGVAFLSRNVANYNIGIEVVDISADYLSVNLVGYGVAVDSEGALDGNIMCGHLEILSVRSANLPAGEGVAFLSRNGSDCNIGIEVVDISVDYLSANLVGYVVMVDSERAVKENVLCRHDEMAVVINFDNVCYVSGRSPTVEGVAGLGRNVANYNIGFEDVGFSVTVILVVHLVGNVVLLRIPLCVQIPAVHQKLVKTDCHFVALGAGCIGVPAAELVAVRSGKLIVANDMGIAGGSVYNVGRFRRAGNSAVVRVIGYLDRDARDVAVDMIAVRAVVLYGVPDNSNIIYIKAFVQYRERVRGITLLDVFFAIWRPVVLGEETEVGRRKQIVGVNAIGIEFALVSGLLARFGQMTIWVTGRANCTYYAAVRSLIRQIVSLALAFAVLRNAEVRQQDKVHSIGRGRFRRSRGVGSPPCSERQVVARHQVVGLILFARCFIIPAVKGEAVALSGRNGDWHVGINFALRVVAARDSAAVFVIGQIVFLCRNVNINGSVEIGLAKIEAELILAVDFVYFAERLRVEHYVLDGVVCSFGLTNSNRRNRKGLVVPELPGGESLTVIDTAINDDLIGYAAAITILCIFLVNRPVGDVDLNHLRIFSANQIVEYQIVGRQSEFSPLVRALGKVLKLAIPSMLAIRVSNAGNFGTELGLVIVRPGALMQYALHASLPENGVVVAVRGCSVALSGHDVGDSKTVGSRDAVAVRGDFQRAGAVLAYCLAVGNPVFSFNRLGHRDVHREVETVDKAVGLICRVLRLVVYVGRAAYYIIFLRNVSRTFRNGGISAIARLRAVRTAVCAVVRRSRCGILTLGRLCLGHRRSGISGSFSGVCYGSGIIHRHCDFFVRRKKCDVLIVGQRPARAHGQHHDSRKSSCEQTFARILF